MFKTLKLEGPKVHLILFKVKHLFQRWNWRIYKEILVIFNLFLCIHTITFGCHIDTSLIRSNLWFVKSNWAEITLGGSLIKPLRFFLQDQVWFGDFRHKILLLRFSWVKDLKERVYVIEVTEPEDQIENLGKLGHA